MQNNNRKIFDKLLSKTKIYLAIIFILLVIISIEHPIFIAPSILIFFILLIYSYYANNRKKSELTETIQDLTLTVDSAAKSSLINSPFPLIILKSNGNIIWRNTKYITEFQNTNISSYLNNLIEDIKSQIEKNEHENNKNKQLISHIQVDKKYYEVVAKIVESRKQENKSSDMIILYFIDETENVIMQKEYQDSKSCVTIMVIDNYEEAMQQIETEEKPQIIAEIDKCIFEWTDKTNGVLIKSDRDRYVYLFEQRYLEQVKEDKFSILDKIKEIYTKENVVNNVKVELLTVTDTGYELAQLYQKHGANDRVVDAIVETDRQGKYSLVGVIPSKYVLRYTYGNNSVIVDTNGNTVKNVDIDNYKSTIYRKGSKDNANAMTDYWYRGETSNIAGVERLSDAKDTIGMKSDGTIIENIIQHRNAEEDINYETALTTGGVTQISADTRMFDIKLDYDINLDNTSGYGVDLKFVFDNIDFGIVERPRQSLIVDKQVSNIQIALPNGNELINGDPRSQNLSGVRVLDDDVYIEIDNEIIQGSTLTITYEITVDNSNCEIDYNDDDYYIYGTVPSNNANWKIATVVDMFDYLPEDLILQSTEENNWERINIQAKESEIKDKILAEKIYDEVKGRQNIIHLANPIFEGMTPGSESVDTSMVVSKLLSTSTDDLTYENDIEIIELKGRKTYDSIPGNYNPTTNESYDPYTDTYTGDELDDDEVEVTITPPTGENKVYWIYGVVGAVMLIVIGLGVVIIKKKVLKK